MPISPLAMATRRQLSLRKSAITTGSSRTVSRALWHTSAWRERTRSRHGQTGVSPPMPPTLEPSATTAISSRCGKTPILTYPYSNKPKRSTRSYSEPDETDRILTAEEIAGINLEGADWADVVRFVTREWARSKSERESSACGGRFKWREQKT